MMERASLESDLERLHGESFAWALACCRWDRTEAEDVIQSTYLKVLDGAARFDGRSSFKTFLFAVIRRTAGERRRRTQFQGLALWRWGQGRAEPERRSSEHEVHLSRASAQLIAALSELPARQKEVLHLVFYQDLSISEAAEVMGVSLGTARQHYDRGKRQLRQILGPTLSPQECFG
jgi:RNA polymerase sigma-70 factor (ECF subfamily)